MGAENTAWGIEFGVLIYVEGEKLFDLIAFVFVLIMALGSACFFDCKIGKTIPLVVSIIISVELWSGFANHLEWGLYILSAFFVVCIVLIAKDYKRVCSRININVIFVMTVAFLLLMIHHAKTIANTWDELAQWAVTVRYSYITNWFAAHLDTNSFYPDYPPATAMFHYFWMNIGDTWQDNRLYISMGLMMISYLVPVLEEIDIKEKWYKILVIDFVLTFIVLSIYPTAYSSLQVDCAMGIIFSWLLYNAVLERNSNLKITALLFGSMTLVLVKNSAVIFVVFALVIWAANIIIEKNKQKFYLLGTILLVSLERIMWQIYIWIQGTAITFDMTYTGANDWQQTALINYFKALFDYSVVGETTHTVFWISTIKVPAIIVVMILILCGMAIVHKNRTYITYNSILLVEMIIYIIATSYLYYHSFGEGEVTRLSSMNRYLGTFFVGNILFYLSIVLHETPSLKRKHVALFLVLCCVPCIKLENIFINSLMPQSQGHIEYLVHMNQEYEKKAEFIKNNVDEWKSIHIFNGDIASMNYALTPVRVTTRLWQGEDFGLFEEYSHWYNYVFFDNTTGTIETDLFREQYGHLFIKDSPICDHGLYQVLYEDNQPQLYYIGKYEE